MAVPPDSGHGGAHREVIFEFQRIDNYVRICAVDVATGVEVVAIGDARVSEHELKELGLRKLMRRLQADGHEMAEDNPRLSPDKSRGRWV